MAKGPPGSGAQIAAQSLFTAASAANAIPVAGQFVSAGLAIAGLFTKIFGGRRRKKKAEEAAAAQARTDENKKNFRVAPSGGGQTSGVVQAQQSIQPVTQPVTNAATPAFSSYGGGSAPPVQQTLNQYTGIK